MILDNEAQVIADLLYSIDASVRNDLYNNLVSDERDYVSRLVTHFSYPFGIFNKYIVNNISFKSKWFVKVNNQNDEKKFGCDSMITFIVGNKLKVGLFEAKWPRVLKNPNYHWDYTQKASKTSHFSNQIERQSRWTNCAAIWEMFFFEGKVGAENGPFDKNGSTCVKHIVANSFIKSHLDLDKIWNNEDLSNLIKIAQKESSNAANLKQIIFDILTCKFGDPISIDINDKYFELISNDEDTKVSCPIISINDDNESDEIINGFMRENGLSFFQQLEIESNI